MEMSNIDMENKTCKVCNKMFPRQWNLKRHLKDIHEIYEYRDVDLVKQKSESYSYPSSIKKEDFRNPENNMSKMNYYQIPPEFHNFTNEFSIYDIHNSKIYENFESISMDKDSRLTLPDMRILQHALLILRNYLQRIYPNLPNQYIMNQLGSLYCLCYSKQSLQPLLNIYKRNRIWHLWPLK